MRNEFGWKMPTIASLMIAGTSGTSIYLSQSHEPEIDLAVAMVNFALIFSIAMFCMGRLVRTVAVFCPAPQGNMQYLLTAVHSAVSEFGYRLLPQTAYGLWRYEAGPTSGILAGHARKTRNLAIDDPGSGWLRLIGSAALIKEIKKSIAGTVPAPYSGPQPFVARGKGLLIPGLLLFFFGGLFVLVMVLARHLPRT